MLGQGSGFQALFGEYDPTPFQRRRSYVKEIEA